MKVIKPTRKSLVSGMFAPLPPDGDWLLLELDAIAEGIQPLWEAERSFFRPSSAGEECPRALTFDMAGHRTPRDARTMRVFATGRAIESNIIDELRRAKRLLSTNLRVKVNDFPFSGSYDALLRRPESIGGGEALGEIKSIREDLWEMIPLPKDLDTNRKTMLEHHRSYLCQWTVYMAALKAEGHDIRDGFILFESKNTQRRKIYWMVPSDELYQLICRVHRTAWAAVQQRMIAATPSGVDKKTGICKWCRRKYLCTKLPDEGCSYDVAKELDGKLRGEGASRKKSRARA